MKNLTTVFTAPKNGDLEINTVDKLRLNADQLGDLQKLYSGEKMLIPVKPWVAPIPQKLYGVLEDNA